ncbi:amidoligase family protein [bacterium]|nr:amidoligase family protein [bacterium]
MTQIDWRLGVEIELLAPPGKTRQDLAMAIAAAHRGSVRRFFHPQSEPSLVPGTPVFHNLTLGFEVLNADHNWVASCVDDLTLREDLARDTPPRPGWYRIISDDERLLRLIQQQASAQQPGERVLDPIATLFGTRACPGPGGMVRVNDRGGASVAIAAPLPGERERPCELITAPLQDRHHQQLEELLTLARSLGFVAPVEGATHLHFDATSLRTAGAMANLIQILWTYGATLKQVIGTNPRCRRLGAWPAELHVAVTQANFRRLPWDEAQAQLQAVKLTKFCDFNLVNCLRNVPDRNTIEVRVLPVWLESQPLLEAASLFVAILRRATEPKPVSPQPPKEATLQSLKALLNSLPLSTAQRSRWIKARAGIPGY